MKIKQKKLKAENFRYVTKEMIRNPMVYLDDFFRSQTKIDCWLRSIHLLINAAAYPDLASPEFQENGGDAKKLIEQLEVAYVIYRQCNLKTQANPLTFFKTREDYLAYLFRGEYTVYGEVNPADSLSKVFSFQSLAEWYETLDDIWLYASQSRDDSYERFGDRILVIRELLLRMAQALADITNIS